MHHRTCGSQLMISSQDHKHKRAPPRHLAAINAPRVDLHLHKELINVVSWPGPRIFGPLGGPRIGSKNTSFWLVESVRQRGICRSARAVRPRNCVQLNLSLRQCAPQCRLGAGSRRDAQVSLWRSHPERREQFPEAARGAYFLGL